jgi:hypothetical protein
MNMAPSTPGGQPADEAGPAVVSRGPDSSLVNRSCVVLMACVGARRMRALARVSFAPGNVAMQGDQPSGHRSDCSWRVSPERAPLGVVAERRASSAFPGEVGPDRAVGCSSAAARVASSCLAAGLESCA